MFKIKTLALLLLLMMLSLVQCNSLSSPAPTTPSISFTSEDEFEKQRLQMVQDQIVQRGVSDPDVLHAMRSVPRHEFVADQWSNQAYADHPLPIGYNQTISQPFIVAWMTELLQLEEGDTVLEVGTGSGYQAAVLAQLDVIVYTTEIIEPLADQAAERLHDMGYDHVHIDHRDGYYGWKEHAPFDGIIVTAAPDHIPPALIAQLEEDGRMVIPVGPTGSYQSLFVITKEDGEVKSKNLGAVRFVPLTR
jgi:protein-L-isoaspartate(D-aspartate) O-methyltransferase